MFFICAAAVGVLLFHIDSVLNEQIQREMQLMDIAGRIWQAGSTTDPALPRSAPHLRLV